MDSTSDVAISVRGCDATLAVAGEEPMEMAPGESVAFRRLSDGELLRDDLQDHDPVLRHAPDCDACRETSATYHV